MNKSFIFISPEIDTEYLNTLYEGDTDILKSIFEEYLAALPETVEKLKEDFDKNDLLQLKATIHKYKSTFGYVGFTNISQSMQYLENKCSFVNEAAELEADFRKVQEQVVNTRLIVTTELAQLNNNTGNNL
jgi:HPt (histidine-containing phosphotransfer) domain-containing protein